MSGISNIIFEIWEGYFVVIGIIAFLMFLMLVSWLI